MADQRQDDTNSRTSSLPSQSTGSQNGDDMTHNEIKGWLMKRTRLSRKWKKQWFLLKNTDLFYGDSPENTMKKIPLANAEISETGVDKKAHAFRLKPKDNSRIYYIQADNESIQNDWMQAICFAKAAGRHGDPSQACVIQ